mmetsp:Transcript_26602/g.77426  ORF Transcript_26602/g.77426 Transcript_26602/m.77426 type:complete len:212 (-) Transcript_26602:19-654(-)
MTMKGAEEKEKDMEGWCSGPNANAGGRAPSTSPIPASSILLLFPLLPASSSAPLLPRSTGAEKKHISSSSSSGSPPCPSAPRTHSGEVSASGKKQAGRWMASTGGQSCRPTPDNGVLGRWCSVRAGGSTRGSGHPPPCLVSVSVEGVRRGAEKYSFSSSSTAPGDHEHHAAAPTGQASPRAVSSRKSPARPQRGSWCKHRSSISPQHRKCQ